MVTDGVKETAKKGAARYYEQQVELLKEFAAIDCGTGDEAGNEKAVKIVENVLGQLGAECERVYYPGVGTHVIARLKPEHPQGKIIINSHLDTVFHPGDAQQFPARIEGDWMYGLGVADCKGGFVTSAFAVKIMQEAGLLPQKEIVMIYSCDEETGSHTGREIFKRESEGAQYAFVFEPARNKNGVITKRKGQAFVEVSVEGVEAHAALNYKQGSSATLELAHKILMMQEMEDEEKGIHYNVGRMSGAVNSLAVAGKAWCEAAVSLNSPDSINQIMADMQTLEKTVFVEGCKTETKINVMFPTQERTQGNMELYELVRKAGNYMNLELPEEESAGPSDACFFSTNGVATVDAMGPFMKDIHTTSERVYLPALLERTELFCLVLAMIS